jgi:2-polyprenyl-3-methyl-5-hydroxy-6-metoxy-1,4-benzoquinol methylase
MKKLILSPLTGKQAKIIDKISKHKITKLYLKAFNYDPSYLLGNNEYIYLCECIDTGYKFYYPFNIDGDGPFYEYFQKFDWYYMPWKWEHQITNNLIRNDMNILEVGCAKGDFLLKIKQNFNNVNVEGLELNNLAANEAINNGLNVQLNSIQDFSLLNKNKYDIVCSFQVLEHIAEPKSFIEASINVLKPNGKLIICVPNNDSFIKYDNGGILNLPPHHMGLWGNVSLKNLTNIFDIENCELIYEPLQNYHNNWFVYLKIKKYFKFNLISKILFKIIKILKLDIFILKNYNDNIGHSIIAVYTKK